MLFGTNLKYTKAFNYRIVLETIRLFGPLSRADIARRSELTAQTISNITRRLIAGGLIKEGRRMQEGRGAPATALALNPKGAYSIGLDLDQDHLTALLLDLGGNVRQRVSRPLDFPAPDEAIELMVVTARELMARQGLSFEKIWGVGVGLPGPLGISEGSVTVSVANPKAFPGWNDYPVIERLKSRLNCPVYLENNATAAAIGERWYGCGQHIATFFYIYLGLGLGGGVIINGHPFEGFRGNAGELGYTPIPGGETDAEGYFKHPHLGVYFHLPRLYGLLSSCGVEVSRVEGLEEVYKSQHPCLLEWLDTGARHLAPILLAAEYLIEPQAIFLGGRWPVILIQALKEKLDRLLPDLRVEGKMYVPALLQADAGVDAAALGLATIPLYESLAPEPRLLMMGGGDGAGNPSASKA